MKKNPSVAVQMIAVTLSLAGCGSIVYGTKQTVPIMSNPPGALVRLPTGSQVTTPTSVELRRAEEQLLIFELEGYQTERVMLRKHFNVLASILGNILWLGLGLTLDALTGGIWTLEPEQVTVELTREATAQKHDGNTGKTLD